MSKNSLIVLLVAVGFVACSGTTDTRDDAAVLRATAEHICANDRILVEIISSEPAQYEVQRVPADWQLRREYEQQLSSRTRAPAEWQPGPICANTRVVAGREIAAAFENDPRIPPGWETFFETFKGARGYSAYSRPIYSEDGRHAVIFLASHCDGLCGSGHVIELEWIDGRWLVARSAGTWIS